MAYAVLLLAVVHHAFAALFLDYSGGYEAACRRYFPLLLSCLLAPTLFAVAPSAIYSRAAAADPEGVGAAAAARHFGRRHCELAVPSLVAEEGGPAAGELAREAEAAYRLCYEVRSKFQIFF